MTMNEIGLLLVCNNWKAGTRSSLGPFSKGMLAACSAEVLGS